MKVTLDNCLIIENPTFELLTFCKTRLVVDNPDYIKKARMGKWTGGTPDTICLYEKQGNRLFLPFGVWDRAFYERFKSSFESVESRISPKAAVFYGSCIKPYAYQEKAVKEALRAKNGILVMPCGAGKTQTALEVVSWIGGRTLWLTHTQDLLNQSMSRAKSVYNLPSKMYGTITSGKVNVSEGITFATVQTLSKIDLTEYKHFWDVIIVDECQHCCGSPTRVTQFYKVISRLSARHKYGLTATPKRADGLEVAMFALLGPVIHEVSKAEVANTTCPVNVQVYQTGYMPDLDLALAGDGTLNYAGLVDDLTHNDDRFWFVLSTIEKLPKNAPVLVLANRVEYLNKLNDNYFGASVCLSGMGNTKKEKEERKKALKALNDGDIDCIFASYQLAAEGLDCPNLRYVVFATPEKDSTRIQQAAGRVGRKADGKEFGTVIDFVDDFGMLKGWARQREKIYMKLGYQVEYDRQ